MTRASANMRHIRERPQQPAIVTYLEDRTEPMLHQLLAAQSTLPLSELHQSSDYRGIARSDQNTSLMLTSCDHTLKSGTPSQELPGITRGTSEVSPESITASFGERQLENQRLLDIGSGGALIIPPLPAQRILECPFNLLFCYKDFSNVNDWVQHSLTHFGSCAPSPFNACCFCEAVFDCSTGLQSWMDRMMHVSLHHRLGHRLAHARPDFELFAYMWRNKLISTAEYRDLKGNIEDRLRVVVAHPAQHVSPNERTRAHTETFSNTRRRNAR